MHFAGFWGVAGPQLAAPRPQPEALDRAVRKTRALPSGAEGREPCKATVQLARWNRSRRLRPG